jgi:hypothetical protein
MIEIETNDCFHWGMSRTSFTVDQLENELAFITKQRAGDRLVGTSGAMMLNCFSILSFHRRKEWGYGTKFLRIYLPGLAEWRLLARY